MFFGIDNFTKLDTYNECISLLDEREIPHRVTSAALTVNLDPSSPGFICTSVDELKSLVNGYLAGRETHRKEMTKMVATG